jgi:N,N'-diacetyllegionaminate synthase
METRQGLSGKIPGETKVLIIAEAGVNHNGSLELAFKLVDAAYEAGADIIKFQTWKTENVVTIHSPKAKYQSASNHSDETQFEMLKKLELPYSDFIKLKNYCETKGIEFLSTADEIESAHFLNSLQDFFKVGSAELTDIPFLRKLSEFKKPIILSTGMGTLGEIEIALRNIEISGLPRNYHTVLHCNTEYPTPLEDVNLLAIKTIREAFRVRVGYSDHTIGSEIPIAAVALGARIIEKHFTLNKSLQGPDHIISASPEELKALVKSIRSLEIAMGNGIKTPSESEIINIPIIRKSIVAKKKIEKGELFTPENITVKRPGTGLSPLYWDLVVGRQSTKEYNPDEFIEL